MRTNTIPKSINKSTRTTKIILQKNEPIIQKKKKHTIPRTKRNKSKPIKTKRKLLHDNKLQTPKPKTNRQTIRPKTSKTSKSRNRTRNKLLQKQKNKLDKIHILQIRKQTQKSNKTNQAKQMVVKTKKQKTLKQKKRNPPKNQTQQKSRITSK